VLISPRQLVDRLRHPRSRADELAMLRARFTAQPTRRQASAEQNALADELRTLRTEAHAATQKVSSCERCAKGHPLPSGRWDGGHCCGGNTGNLFNPDEVAALKLAGTVATKLKPPSSDHAGCAFRGPVGCSLSPVDRPNICLRYVCLDLRAEMKDSGQWARISELNRKLRDTFERFVSSRREPSWSELTEAEMARWPAGSAPARATASTAGSRR
jgi:hypothetical protein